MGQGLKVTTDRAKDFKGTSKRLLSYLKPRKFQIIAVFFFAILGTLFSIIAPKVIAHATDIIIDGVMKKVKNIGGIDFSALLRVVVILISLYVISSVFIYIQQYIMASVAQKTVYQMREDVNNKLNSLPLKYFDGNSHGEILSRLTNDMDNIASTLQQSITQLITSFITIVGVVIMMLTISPIMTLISLVTLPLCGIATKIIASKSRKYFAAQQREIGELNGHVEEMYTGHVVIKAFNHEEISIDEFNEINDRLYEVGWKAQFISGIIMPTLNFISNIGYVVICVLGGFMVTQGKITIGDIQAFIQYSRQFTQPLIQTANIANILQSTIASAERVFEILDEKEETKDGEISINKKDIKGNVDFSNVKFGYNEDKIIIKDMNLNVKSGQKIAIVGPTGAGKTTIVNLLMRFYDVNSGSIKVDGIDIRDMKRGELRGLFGMVLQDTWLFNGTIKENIAYGNDNASENDVINAAKAAYADSFIRTLPNGYDTILNEDATNISQGQKQLLTIARAIMKDPQIMILDEATSSVDTRTEGCIQRAMEQLMQGKTSFVIAHRLSTIKDADLILVMKDGDVIEKGTHDELLSEDGFYGELYNSQFVGKTS